MHESIRCTVLETVDNVSPSATCSLGVCMESGGVCCGSHLIQMLAELIRAGRPVEMCDCFNGYSIAHS